MRFVTSIRDPQSRSSDAAITTGDIADWSDKHKKMLTDVPGIGPAKAEQIDEILNGFWKILNETPEDEGKEDADGDAGEDEDDEE